MSRIAFASLAYDVYSDVSPTAKFNEKENLLSFDALLVYYLASIAFIDVIHGRFSKGNFLTFVVSKLLLTYSRVMH